MKSWRIYLVAIAAAGGLAQPVSAKRTLVDMPTIDTRGYCAPNDPSGCGLRNLGFTIRIGTADYSQFVLNGNGTLSLGGAVDFTLATGTLANYGIPVFSPLINNYVYEEFSRRYYPSLADAPAPQEGGSIDTAYVGRLLTSTTPNSISMIWFQCTGWTNCGPDSRNYSRPFTLADPANPTADQLQNVFGLTLTQLTDGFQVDYFYNQPRGRPAPGESSTVDPYGFYLPGGSSLQTTGGYQNRTFRFDATGQLVTDAVPEPQSWALLVVGFAVVGWAMRSTGRARQSAMA